MEIFKAIENMLTKDIVGPRPFTLISWCLSVWFLLQQKIRAKHWVRGSHLDVAVTGWPSCWTVCNVCAVFFILSPSAVSIVPALRK